MFLGVPLTSKNKSGKFYFEFELKDRKSTAILSQLRILSSKRLIRRMGKTSNDYFDKTEVAIKKLISSSE